MSDFYYINDIGMPIKSDTELDTDLLTVITAQEYDDLVTAPPTLEATPVEASLVQQELTPLEKLESIGLSVEELRTLLNENA